MTQCLATLLCLAGGLSAETAMLLQTLQQVEPQQKHLSESRVVLWQTGSSGLPTLECGGEL
jgi:protein-disulfide isomerase-like protein with CxxC motif